ncbi:hypothetical protein Athai_07730 [Actinocatenispora thailandica]|uniref:Uncharacterized protein n=1 Tax=Actinocatenispora thailandica TaxID=227318 RepID=A0A7R7DKD1_9ACTN|nr:hypothetical protein [Actinocatenispora thailandica]BCJ33270.1 hypothetical protein Athai_07730 [Actinocatenispora thailandica]
MAVPRARTFDEAYLYMELRPCACGEAQFDRQSDHSSADGAFVVRYSGRCPACGRDRSFTFELPTEPPVVSFDVRYGPDDVPSTLLDAGEWLGAAELFTMNAEAVLGSGDLSDDDLTTVYYLLSAATAATAEVLKFAASGADEVPEASFWTPAGRLALQVAPERFRRDAIEAELAGRRKALADFEHRYEAG